MFYSKNINRINETNVEIPVEEMVQESFGIEDEYSDDVLEEDKTVELEKPKTSKRQKDKQFNFFKLILVFIISFAVSPKILFVCVPEIISCVEKLFFLIASLTSSSKVPKSALDVVAAVVL